MKCDELEEMVLEDGIGQMWKCYDVEEVKEAIAELKEFAEDACLERDDNQTAIDELREEIESLKASHYAEMVDAGMRERRLRRALYKVCSMWAHIAVAFFSSYITKDRWRRMEVKCRAKAEEYK